MKNLVVIALMIFLSNCNPAEEGIVTESVPQESAALTDSFRVRNAEIRGDILTKLVERNIPHWINDDGSIGYELADADEIDSIYYRAVGEYAARN